MSTKALRVNQDSAQLYDGSGHRLAVLSRLVSKLDGASVELGASDVGRIFSQNWQMNPTTQYLPSNIVTPHTVWMPYAGQINMLLHVLWAIKTFMDNMEESSDPDQNTNHIRKIERFQIVDFSQRLPENF